MTARAVLGDGFAELEAANKDLLERHNLASDGSMRLEGRYLQTIARKVGTR